MPGESTSEKIEENKIQNDVSSIDGSASLEISFDDILNSLVQGYGKKGDEVGKRKFAENLSNRLRQEISKYECSKRYNILVIFDNTVMVKGDSDRIYQAINEFSEKKDILLVLLSGGGEIGSAYLIGQLCREYCKKNFIVTVPRYAKSAATLLATAADEIHMGSLSELGPIDPQIKIDSQSEEMVPVLGLKNSIEHIAGLVNKIPQSAQMFASYLALSIKPIQIGYYERVAESAAQYAEKLLRSHIAQINSTTSKEIAQKLVYEYKDHGFVIDKSEAKGIFGDVMIKSGTEEYDLGNAIYKVLSEIEKIAEIMKYRFYFIGSTSSAPNLIKKI